MRNPGRSRYSRLLLLSLLASLSVKAIGLLRQEEDALVVNWGMPLERKMSLLSDRGRLDDRHTPWADYSWSASGGSIAHRWMSSGETHPLRFRIVPVEDLLKISAPEARAQKVRELSPAEKFDLVRMKFNYPLLQRMRRDLHSPGHQGDLSSALERGWAIASTHLTEPRETRVMVRIPNAHDPRIWQEIEVPFAASDVKALLAYYFGRHAFDRARIHRIAGPQGIDPASFHVLLANMATKTGRSFVLDVALQGSIRPRPVVAYESDVRYQSEGNYRVATRVEVARLRAPDWKPYGYFNLDTDTLEFEYTLEVNSRGEISRGQWVSEEKPVAAWRSDLPKMDRAFQDLAQSIYQPVKKNRDLSALEDLFE